MNELSPSTPATGTADSAITADAISRRAYELWEQEGRPEGRHLEHWLRAEQDLSGARRKSDDVSAPAPVTPAQTDVQPLQGTRAAAAVNRDNKPATKPTPKPATPVSGGSRAGRTPAGRMGGK